MQESSRVTACNSWSKGPEGEKGRARLGLQDSRQASASLQPPTWRGCVRYYRRQALFPTRTHPHTCAAPGSCAGILRRRDSPPELRRLPFPGPSSPAAEAAGVAAGQEAEGRRSGPPRLLGKGRAPPHPKAAECARLPCLPCQPTSTESNTEQQPLPLHDLAQRFRAGRKHRTPPPPPSRGGVSCFALPGGGKSQAGGQSEPEGSACALLPGGIWEE